MGLDISIKNKIKKHNTEDTSFLGSEAVYFRKFYPFHNWVLANCEKIEHDWYDIYLLTHENIIDFEKYYFSKDSEKEWWFDYKEFYEESTRILIEFLKTTKKNPQEYYYTFTN